MAIPAEGPSRTMAPMAWAAMSLCAGVLLGTVLPGRGEWAFAGAAVWLAVFVGVRRLGWRGVSVLAALVCVGVGLIQVELKRTLPDDVGQWVPERGAALVRMEMRVDEGPRWSGGNRGQEGVTWTGRAIEVGGRGVAGRVRVRVGEVVDVKVGDRVEVIGELSGAGAPGNPGQADFGWIDRVSGVRGTVDVRGAGQVRVVSREPGAVGGAVAWWRAGAGERLSRGFGEEDSQDELLMRALFLGEVDSRLAGVRDAFQRLGVTHHLAVSGTHLAVVGGFVFVVLRGLMAAGLSMWITPRRALGVTLGVIVGYGLAVVPGEAVTRSVWLAVIVGVGLLLGRGVSVVNLLGATCVGMVLWEPTVVLRPGFQLTFFVVWVLCVGTPALGAFVREFRDEDVRIADRWREATGRGFAGGRGGRMVQAGGVRGWLAGGRAGWGVRLRRWGWGWGVTTGAASVVAWMAAGPIVAYHFQQVSPWAAVASVVLAPMVFFAIVVAGLKVVLTVVVPWGAGVWAVGAGAAGGMLRWSVEGLGRVPAGDVGVPGLWGWAAVMGVVCLCVPLLPGVRGIGNQKVGTGLLADAEAIERRKRRGRRGRAGAWGLAVMATVGLPVVPLVWGSQPEGVRMTVLSVGSAQCIVVDGRAMAEGAGGAIVIDAGSNGGDVYRSVVEPFLRARAVRKIRMLVLTHPDSDHTSGAELLIRRRGTGGGVGELVVGEQLVVAAAREPGSPAGRAVAAAREMGVPVRVVAAGELVDAGGVRIDVLHPQADRWQGLSENDASLVLRIQYAGRVVVVGSDVEEVGQRRLLAEPGMLRADVVVAPHHGSWESTLLPLVRATEAGVVVVSDDELPSGGQARFLREMEGMPGVRLMRTSERGAVEVGISPEGGVGVRGFRDEG